MEKLKQLYQKYQEAINYLIFGGLSTVVNFISYYISNKVIGIEEVISSAISWFCAVLFAYVTNKCFVFESKTHGFKDTAKEITSFFACRVLSGILCDVGTFAVMVKVWHINDMVAKIITQIMVIIVNYLLSKFFIFKNNNKEKKCNT